MEGGMHQGAFLRPAAGRISPRAKFTSHPVKSVYQFSILLHKNERPVLSARRVDASVLLSWTTNAVNFTLESATNLGPGTIWAPVPTGPVVVGDQTHSPPIHLTTATSGCAVVRRKARGRGSRQLGKTLSSHGAATRKGLAFGPDGFEDGFGLGEFARGQLRMNLLAVDDNFKRAAAGRHQREGADRLLEPQ